MSSNVFIDNVDDYVAPSQACINPLFSVPGSKDTSDEKGAAAVNPSSQGPNNHDRSSEPDKTNGTSNEAVGVRRRGRRKRTALTSETDSSSKPTVPKESETSDPKSIVQASLADCLACSGCVTTTETVLIEEQHSLSVLRDLLLKPTDNSSQKQQVFVVTMSPAAWADLLRQAGLSPPDNEQDLWTHKRQFSSILKQLLNISCVLDGNLPLTWSLEESAKEFCDAFRRKQKLQQELSNDPPTPSLHHQYQQKLWPSRALSKGSLQFKSDTDELLTIQVDPTKAPASSTAPPLLSASCPAVVCLVEKTAHLAVPHLASTASPMSLAGAWLKQQQSASTYENDINPSPKIYHIAVMPCHDKKLEASRTDFQSATNEKDVDMVITTAECWKLLEKSNQSDHSLLELFQQSALAIVGDQLDIQSIPDSNGLLLAHITQTKSATTGESSDDPFVSASGGYADYIFQKACMDLFGVKVDRVPWEPGTWHTDATNSSVKRSARMAAASSRRKDFYQAILYKRIVTQGDGASTETFTLEREEHSEKDESIASIQREPVLCFAIAYGMQTLQRILKPFDNQNSSETTPPLQFDYVEAMACPSGCINGGGQLRISSKELPTQTKNRLSETRTFFSSPSSSMGNNMPDVLAPKDLHTTYHVVPPMQLSQGAAAGMAVQDIQW